jgi:uncharacterized protein (DUF1330 family)
MMNYALIGLSLVALTIGSVQAQSKFNPGYLVAELEIIDAASMQKFGEAASPIVKAYGGEFLARNGKVVAGFGTAPKSVTIIKFESLEKAEAYYNSSEYKALVPLRDKAAKYRGYLVEGLDHVQ